MAKKSLIDRLGDLFSGPFPDFAKRHIVFWQDPSGDYQQDFQMLAEEKSLPGPVEYLELTGCNSYSAKKKVLIDQPECSFLIYNPLPVSDLKTDVFYDVRQYAEIFKADKISFLLEEMGLEDSAGIRKVVERYKKFLDSEKRRNAWRKITSGTSKPSEQRLCAELLCAAVGLNQLNLKLLVCHIFNTPVVETKNSVFVLLDQYGMTEDFWNFISSEFGFGHDPDRSIKENLHNFIHHVLIHAFADTYGSEIPGLENLLLSSFYHANRDLFECMAKEMDSKILKGYTDEVWNRYKLSEKFSNMEIQDWISLGVFQQTHEELLKRYVYVLFADLITPVALKQQIQLRSGMPWFTEYQPYYNAVYAVVQMHHFLLRHPELGEASSSEVLWKDYAGEYYLVDSYYRKFHQAYETLKASGVNAVELNDLFKGAAIQVEDLYQQTYLEKLGDSWSKAIESDLNDHGYVKNIHRQRDFFDDFVKPELTVNKRKCYGKYPSRINKRVYVIVSDALRYETAHEIRDVIGMENNGIAEITSVQSEFPTITKFGMPALINFYKPNILLDEKNEPKINLFDKPTGSRADREKINQTVFPASLAVDYESFSERTKKQKNELVKDKELVYIYHNEIDKTGEHMEKKVFAACEDTISHLTQLTYDIARADPKAIVFIVADHGFIYTARPLEENQKLSSALFSKKPYELGRRYALASVDTEAEFMLEVNISQGTNYEGVPVKGFAPRDYSRIKRPGSGSNFVHGGISLQEMMVPVVVYRNRKAGSADYKYANDVKLELASRKKITSNDFILSFLQDKPVSDVARECVYSVHLEDRSGIHVTDTKDICANSRDFENAHRTYKQKFHLYGDRQYSKKDQYYVVLENRDGIIDKIPVVIDVLISDDEFEF